FLRLEFVARPYLAEFARTLPPRPALQFHRKKGQMLGRPRPQPPAVRGSGYCGRAGLALASRRVGLARHRAGEKHATVRDPEHAAERKTASVAGTFDLVDDGRLDIAGTQEVSMQGVCLTRRVDCPLRG